MADTSNLSGKVSLETTDFKTGISELQRQIKIVESGFKSVAAGMDDWTKSSEGTEARLKTLTTVIGLQQQKVALLTAEYQKVVAEKGADSRAAEQLQIRINNETAALNANQLELNQVSSGTTKMVTAQTSALSATDSLKLSITAFNSALQIAQQVLSTVKKAYDETLGETEAYDLSIRKQAQVLGITTEETSRLIKAGEALGVEQGALTTALDFASKHGLQPTIENLANASDELLAMTDVTERNAAAAKQFGKGWVDAEQVILAGGEKIRANTAAVGAGNVVTEKAAYDAEQMRVATFQLNEAFTALKNNLGNQVIPELADFMSFLVRATDAYQAADGNAVQFWITLGKSRQELEKSRKAAGDHTAALQAEGLAYFANKNAVDNNTQAIIDNLNAVKGQKVTYDEAAHSTENYKHNMDDAAGATAQAGQAADDARTAMQKLQTAEDNLSKAQGDLDTATKNWTAGAAGDAANALEKSGVKGEKLAEALGAIDSVMGTNLQMQAAYTKNLQDAAAQYAKTGDLAAYKTKLGEIKDTYMPFNQAVIDATTSLQNMNAAVNALHDKTITITTNYVTNGSPSSGGSVIESHKGHWVTYPDGRRVWVPDVGGKASGGPVVGGTPVMVGEAGPELFIPPVNGSIISNNNLSKLSNSKTVNLGGIHIDARGNPNANQIGRAAEKGVLEALRSVGMQ
jgi:hypothetical protein